MRTRLLTISPVDDESSELPRQFLESELDFYAALAEKAALHYSLGQFRTGRKAHSVAAAGYAALRRYVSEPHFASSLAGTKFLTFKGKMANFAEMLSSLSACGSV